MGHTEYYYYWSLQAGKPHDGLHRGGWRRQGPLIIILRFCISFTTTYGVRTRNRQWFYAAISRAYIRLHSHLIV